MLPVSTRCAWDAQAPRLTIGPLVTRTVQKAGTDSDVDNGVVDCSRCGHHTVHDVFTLREGIVELLEVGHPHIATLLRGHRDPPTEHLAVTQAQNSPMARR